MAVMAGGSKHSTFRPSVALARERVAHWQARLAEAMELERQLAAGAKHPAAPAAPRSRRQLQLKHKFLMRARLAKIEEARS